MITVTGVRKYLTRTYLHLRATRKYEPTYVKTCVPLLDEIWEHLPKDSFAEQRVADAIGGLIEKEPCLQD